MSLIDLRQNRLNYLIKHLRDVVGKEIIEDFSYPEDMFFIGDLKNQ